MKKTWNIEVNGQRHTIEYKAFFGMKVTLDGEVTKVKSENWYINMVDYKLPIADADVRLVVIGGKANLAINGVYLDSSDKYEPLEKVPGFVNVLIAISVIGAFFVNGLIGALIAMMFSGLYVRAALSNKKVKLVFTILGFLVVEALFFFVVLMVSIFMLA